jgi:hypothetical protein
LRCGGSARRRFPSAENRNGGWWVGEHGARKKGYLNMPPLPNYFVHLDSSLRRNGELFDGLDQLSIDGRRW